MDARCKSEPVSWLRLERYHLGEGDAAERAAVEGHLATCEVCAACLASIASDDAVALPPLPAVARAEEAAGRDGPRGPRARGGDASGGGDGVEPGRSPTVPGTAGVKGGELAFTLVRDDDERIAGPGGVYRDGDRFKAVVTCPPGLAATFDLVVFDDGGASYPLGPGEWLACGNDVPLAGALRLTGAGEETVPRVVERGRSREARDVRAGAGRPRLVQAADRGDAVRAPAGSRAL